ARSGLVQPRRLLRAHLFHDQPIALRSRSCPEDRSAATRGRDRPAHLTMAGSSVASEVQSSSGTRPKRTQRGPVAIVDIGSNSVRIVIYESQTRTPATIDNEKAICAIGRDLVTTGRLHAEGCTLALRALARFKLLADGLDVGTREAVAT